MRIDVFRLTDIAGLSHVTVLVLKWYDFVHECVGIFNLSLFPGLSLLNALPGPYDATTCAEVERNQPAAVQLCGGTG